MGLRIQPGRRIRPGKKSDSDQKFELKGWSAHALWSYDLREDQCKICRCKLMEKCIKCAAAGTTGDCTLARGECSHAFHLHCIERYTTTSRRPQTCPLDSYKWEYKRD